MNRTRRSSKPATAPIATSAEPPAAQNAAPMAPPVDPSVKAAQALINAALKAGHTPPRVALATIQAAAGGDEQPPET